MQIVHSFINCVYLIFSFRLLLYLFILFQRSDDVKTHMAKMVPQYLSVRLDIIIISIICYSISSVYLMSYTHTVQDVTESQM